MSLAPVCDKHETPKYRATDRTDARGWRWVCRACSAESKRRWAERTNHESARRYTAKNRERDNARRAKLHAANPEKRVWHNMKRRCTNPAAADYHWYGGRGITVCEKWMTSYDAFLADVGRRPGPEYSIDRIDNNGNYEPGNVRWATVTQQNRNRRPRLAA